jgi:hypothetical protein
MASTARTNNKRKKVQTQETSEVNAPIRRPRAGPSNPLLSVSGLLGPTAATNPPSLHDFLHDDTLTTADPLTTDELSEWCTQQFGLLDNRYIINLTVCLKS